MNNDEHHGRRIYIMGAPRSGTTFLAYLLRLHPDCFMTYETRTIPSLYQGLVPPRNTKFGTYRFEWASEGSENAPPVGWSVPHLEHYVAKAEDHATEDEMTPLIQAIDTAIYDHLFPDTQRVGDKSPSYANQDEWRYLRRAWPDCQIIHIMRDFDATVDSIRRQTHWKGQYRKNAPEIVGRSHKNAEDCVPRFDIQLEDIEQNPQCELGQMLDYLELPTETYNWEEAVIRAKKEDGKTVN